jgi:hypothetical protein
VLLIIYQIINLEFYLLFIISSDRIERIIASFLFSWNLLPKSWIYFAVNEFQDRSEEYDSNNNLLPSRMHSTDRAAVFKIKYFYYF